MISNIASLLVVLAAIPATLSVLVYARVPWRHTETGRHLMAYMSAIAAVLVLASIRILFRVTDGGLWFEVLRLAVFAGIPVVMWWRLWLLVKAQRLDVVDREDA